MRAPPRRRYTTKETQSTTAKEAQATTANQVLVTTTPKPRFKFATRRPYLRTTTGVSSSSTSPDEESDSTDQTLESSNQKPRPLKEKTSSSLQEVEGGELLDSTELGDIALTLHPLQTAPLPSITRGTSTTTEKMTKLYERVKTRKRPRISTTARPQLSSTTPGLISSSAPIRRRRPQPFDRVTPEPIKYTTGSYTPITVEYDYYDEGDVRVFGQLPANSKVLIHNTGAIQCLDQGNFPHPVSCKKFISCAKMENSDVIGWEYTCPSGLSFDPVGGICNWSAGLGCKG